MPLDPSVAASLGGSAVDQIGSLTNSLMAAGESHLSRKFSEKMYNKQYADNIAFWRMQNEYNSPQSQMARFQAAGLNPHLIYGQGNSGNAGSIQTPDIQPVSFRSPDVGGAISSAGLSLINSIYDLDIKQAQADNLKAQNTVIHQDALLRMAQTEEVATRAGRGKFDLELERELRDVSADARREQLRRLKNENDVLLNRDAREAARNSVSITEAAERMLNMREQRLNMQAQRKNIKEDYWRIRLEQRRLQEAVHLMKKDGTLKQLDIDLRRLGVNPSDPTWSRIIGRLLTEYLGVGGYDDILDTDR